MLFKLDDNIDMVSEEQYNLMKSDPDCLEEFLIEPFKLKNITYQDGIYSFWLEMFLDGDIENEFGVKFLADPFYKCSNADYGIDRDINFHCFGICDSIDNLLTIYPFLIQNDNSYVVTLSLISKEPEKEPNFRWHKGGPYIGKHLIKHEYFFHEEGINEIYNYRIYRVLEEF